MVDCDIFATRRISCPGRDAAFFTLLRRAGTVPNAGVRYGPGSAAHHAAKGGALRCVRGTHEACMAPVSSSFHLRPYATADEDAAITLWRDTWQQAYPEIDFAARVNWWR